MLAAEEGLSLRYYRHQVDEQRSWESGDDPGKTHRHSEAEAFGLSEFLGEPISRLSSGTAKKLWYVLATISCRPVMILDEPFNAIDVATVRCMVKEVNAWSKRNLVMLVSHLPPDGLEVRGTLVLDKPKTAGCGDCAMT